MVNRPKQIGTKAETDFVKHARANGFDHELPELRAHRIILAGSQDEGDVALCPGVVVEVKGGQAAEIASDAQVRAWLEETETERLNRGAKIGFLVRKRKGKGSTSVGAWHAHLSGWAFAKLSDLSLGYRAEYVMPPVLTSGRRVTFAEGLAHLPAVEMRVDEALELVRAAGYGPRP